MDIVKECQETDEKLRNRPVTKHGYTYDQVSQKFDAIFPKDDWKGPFIVEDVTHQDLMLVLETIIFYTATEPSVKFNPHDGTFTVGTIGYRFGPAGDH